MSNLAVNAITDASGGNTASINGATPTTDNTMGRNRVINGAMEIDQRNAGASVTLPAASSQYLLDRFAAYKGTSGATVTAQQSTTAPAGFVNSFVFTASTGAAPAAGDINATWQVIEGLNVADFGWGTANAQTVTLSFWVRSSVTGTHSVSFTNSAANRWYVATYDVSSANTWEYKTITIAGDTSGTWATNNDRGIQVIWDLGCGSNYNGAAGSWGSSSVRRTSGSVQWIATTGATFYITGVQLEAGSVATSFERRQYGQELALCQRYLPYIGGIGGNQSFGQCYANTTTIIRAVINFPVQARTYPTGLVTSTASGFVCQMQGSVNLTASALAITSVVGLTNALIQLTVSGATAGQPGSIYNPSAGYMYFTGCEL